MNRRWRILLITVSWMLIALTPVVGILPGPGGIFVFAGGLALLLRNSHWAKRRYAAAKRRWPKLGRMTDKLLRRSGVLRRQRAGQTSD